MMEEKKVSENALNDDDLEQVTGGKRMKKVQNGKGSRIAAMAGSHAAATANGKATIAEAEAAAIAYVNEN